ncbi:MAG: hypothetical protein ACSHX3_07815 [Litorimonas sp.]
MTDSRSKDNASFLTENAAVYRHGAKITYIQMVSLIMGFASGASITKAAERAEVHRDTVKDTFAALRDRLSKPRFKKWLQSDYANLALTNAQDREQMEDARDALFHCHGNIDCQKRFSSGRRKPRVCRSCPVFVYVSSHVPEPEPERHHGDAEAMVDLVDKLRAFYRRLGWNESANSGADQRNIFEKRFRHFEVLSTAVVHTDFDDSGKVTSDEDDWLSIRHLGKALSEELREEPLISSQ